MLVQVNRVLAYVADLAINALPEEPNWGTLGLEEASQLERQRMEQRDQEREGAIQLGHKLNEDEIEAMRALVHEVNVRLGRACERPCAVGSRVEAAVHWQCSGSGVEVEEAVESWQPGRHECIAVHGMASQCMAVHALKPSRRGPSTSGAVSCGVWMGACASAELMHVCAVVVVAVYRDQVGMRYVFLNIAKVIGVVSLLLLDAALCTYFALTFDLAVALGACGAINLALALLVIHSFDTTCTTQHATCSSWAKTARSKEIEHASH